MAMKALSQRLPALRLYQQIILYVIFVVFVPLLVSSFVIYSINQKALKKELVRFTEHTAEIIETDLTAQLQGQVVHTRLIAKVLADGLSRQRSQRDVLGQVLALSQDMPGQDVVAIGLYAGNGERLTALSRGGKTPDSIPESLSPHHARKAPALRVLPYPTDEGMGYQILATTELTYTASGNQTYQPTHVAILRHADSLGQLVRNQNEKLYKGFYLVDDQGQLLAGPEKAIRQQLNGEPVDVNRESWQIALSQLLPGRTAVLGEKTPGLGQQARRWLAPVIQFLHLDQVIDNDDDVPVVDTVLMKLDNGWGVVLESPYQVRQKYVKRARTQTLLILLGHMLLAGGFTAIYIGGLRRNFRQLIKGIQALADGRYARRIRLLTNWFTPFEIVYLTGEFNRMSRRREEAWEASETLTNELRHANNKLAELDKMKSNLIDTVSHELRTPLTSIKGYTNQLIRHNDQLDTDTRVNRLKTIKRQADRLNRLVDDLLVIPELEQQHLRVESQPVSVAKVLERAISLVATRKDALPMAIGWEESVDESMDVLADSDRLEQVLVNLLDNAQKYGDGETPIQVTVGHGTTNALGESTIAISVRNTCLPESLPANQAEVNGLFEKFKRLDDTTTRTTRGTGLGLYITQGLVDAMHGTVTARVADEQFEITVSLPAIAGE